MMNCDIFMRNLDDFIDGDLAVDDNRAQEMHARECAACAKALATARNLQQQAFALPMERAPTRDLWPEIAARLEPARARRRGMRALAAGLAAIAIFAGGMLADRVLRDSRQDTTRIATDGSVNDDYRALPSVDDARRMLPAAQVALIEGDGGLLANDGLQGATEQTLLRNLLAVNIAIRKIETALDDNPGNRNLRELLADLYAQESRILGQAERLRAQRQTPTRTGI
ncbi:MAG TPA: hypothetical protein VF267_10160 [Gammaproteobacteria bacterium]